jgi:hypothetical protein
MPRRKLNNQEVLEFAGRILNVNLGREEIETIKPDGFIESTTWRVRNRRAQTAQRIFVADRPILRSTESYSLPV